MLTPLAVDPGHPVPVSRQPVALPRGLDPAGRRPRRCPHTTLSVVHIPSQVRAALRRRCPSPPGQHAFMLLEDVIRLHLPRALQRLRDPLLPRHPRHARRRPRRSRGAGRGPARQHRGGPARAAHGRPRCGCSTTPTCRRTSWPRWSTSSSCGPEDLYAGRGLHRVLRSASSSTPRSTCRGSRTGRCRRTRCRPSSARPTSGARSARATSSSTTRTTRFDAVTRFVQRGGRRSRRCSPSR